MRLTSRTSFGVIVPLTVAALTVTAAPAQADPSPFAPLAATATAPCVSGGPTAADQAVADAVNPRLNAKLRGAVSAYTASCLRAVVTAVQNRGLPKRAAVIAITTAIVESSIRNLSEEVDHDSLGIFQQRASWGSVAHRLDPEWSTNAFLSKMLDKYPNNSWMTGSIGDICQAVQVSGYPERYQPQAGDAQILVDAVWSRPSAPAVVYDQGDGTMKVYRWTSGGTAFNRASDYESGSFALSNVDDRVASGDVDGDGDSDVVMAYQNADNTWAFHVFRSGVSWAGTWYTGGSMNLDRVGGRLVVGDFNGDGKAEPALVYDEGDGTMKIYRWTSDGSKFNRSTDYESGSFALANVDDRVAAGDVDGDGKDDIVMAYQNADNTWGIHTFRYGSGWTGVWYTGGSMNLDRVAGRLVVGDFNGDGKAEPTVVYDEGDGTMKIYRWTSDGSKFNRSTDYESGSFALANVDDRVAAADADGDGKDDIVMAYQNADNTWGLHTFRYGSGWSGVWYTGGSMNLDRVGGRLVLGSW